ncbi:MAG: hypothetical protein HY593_00650 [Candidatus Omnitrophica bacterium]|nr:hypothetical protein [Candidatus Omnitrophota bacterium]
MRKVRLTREERAIEQTLDEFVPVGPKEFAEIAQAIAFRKKDAVLNIRISRYDLEHLKQKAGKLGIRYQTFISEILRRLAHA